ncbi:MAG: GH36 C-terminal domain-containing protein, partial [Romboutsia timonensis]|nr:GH36 C-terminal domain-containing protein [Romboutsia timonensis]MCI6668475.1 GH36 C-terminal domain-containing protein [Romboutsia timonensis]
VSFVRTLAKPNSKFISLKLVGLDESSKYEILGENIIVGGDELMNIGLNVPELKGDYQAKMWRLKKVK